MNSSFLGSEFFSLAVLFLSFIDVNGFSIPFKLGESPILPDVHFQDPLIVSPFLEKGDYKKAQVLSRVSPDIGNMTSFSGFFTVNKECESNLFFWFFPAQKVNWEEAPLVLWLQGGPGAPSLLGLFDELGPFESFKEGLKKRKYSWNMENNLLFIDQPVGTGYSFTGQNCYPVDENEVGEALYEAVLQFHQLFPNFQTGKFIISGESYAGHFIPALGHFIHKNNPSAKVKINLSAMMIGDGWMDALLQSDYASYLYQLGLIDDKQRDVYEQYQETLADQVAAEDWSKAAETSYTIGETLYDKFVGKEVSVYNYLPNSAPDNKNWVEFVQKVEIRKALHVGNLTFLNEDNLIANILLNDSVQSVKPWVEELLEEYPIIFYNGQVDIICAYPMTIHFLRALQWSGEKAYLDAKRSKWHVGKEIAGYYKGSHHLYDVLVRGAGHMVPKDQPLWAYILVNSVASGSKDDPLHLFNNADYFNKLLQE